MANFSQYLPILALLFSSFTLSILADGHDFVDNLDAKSFGLKKEKLSHFRLYWHDIVSGKNATTLTINPPVANSSSFFGLIRMVDDPLTTGPELGSKLVGRAQGFYMSAAKEQFGLMMVQNFVFVEGKYNGSTITVLGRNEVFTAVREMPIIGGSGLFRFARGYVKLTTQSLDLTTGDAVIIYDCYVLHY